MSEENVELVRDSLDAYARGDLEKVVSHVSPEGELHSAIISGAEGNVYRGHEGVRRWYAETFETFEEVRIEVSEIRDLGARVLVLGQLKAVGRESGVKVDSPTGWIYTISRGMLVKIEGFLSHADALEAAGLRE